MSKKSRKRNKKILTILGLAAAATAASRRNKGTAADPNDGFRTKSNKSVSAGGGQTYAPKAVAPRAVNVVTPPKRSNASIAGDFISKVTDPKKMEYGMQMSNDLVSSKLKPRKRVSLEQGMSNIDTTPIKQYKSGGRTGYSAGGAAKRGISPILMKGKK